MKLSAQENVDRPAAEVFAAVCDFGYFEQLLAKRGVAVERVSDPSVDGVGSAWTAQFDLRGRPFDIKAEVSRIEPDEVIEFTGRSHGLETLTCVTVTSLGATRSRLSVGFEITPTSLTGRLILQPLKLAKGRLSERFKFRVAEIAAGLSGPD